MVEQKISELDSRIHVAVIDAAILIEAGWADFCHETWVCSLSRKDQVERIVERDGKTKEQAEARLDSQMSDEERVKYAHVVLCSKWEHDFTYEQCIKAWRELDERLA